MVLHYAHQDISPGDIAAVLKVLQSDRITQGPVIGRFEKAVADYCGVSHALAVTSGTAALHLGALALGLGPGKRLWTSPNSFVASANCALYCGAEVDFVDIDYADGNMSMDRLAGRLKQARQKEELPDVVVPVHYAGQPCDLDRLAALSAEYGFAVMDDASHALGARFRGQPVGGLKADISILSFHPVKIITTGEGGMVLTNSAGLAEKISELRSHGISRAKKYSHMLEGPWSYVQTDLGFNYRMTDLQAALGLSQMGRLDDFVGRRNFLADRYDEVLADMPVEPLEVHDGRLSARHLYVIRMEGSDQRRRMFDALITHGIQPQVHYIPIHTQPYYRELGFQPGDFPAAERHYAGCLSLPLYPSMSDEDQDGVISAIMEILPGI